MFAEAFIRSRAQSAAMVERSAAALCAAGSERRAARAQRASVQGAPSVPARRIDLQAAAAFNKAHPPLDALRLQRAAAERLSARTAFRGLCEARSCPVCGSRFLCLGVAPVVACCRACSDRATQKPRVVEVSPAAATAEVD